MTYRRLAATAALALALAASGAALAADPANKEAALFGAREDVRQISLSPDGERIAVLGPQPGGRGDVVLVGLVAGGELARVLSASGAPERISDCEWSTAVRLVCAVRTYAEGPVGAGRIGYTRLVAVNADGGDLKLLSARSNTRQLGFAQHGGRVIDWGEAGSVLMTRVHVPEDGTGTRLAKDDEGLGVDRVDTVTLKREIVERPSATAAEYITDGQGAVRIRGLRQPLSSGYAGDRIDYDYRRKGSRDWKDLGALTLGREGGSTGFDPYAVDPDLDVAYGFDRVNGRQALFRVSLDGSGERELVFAHDQVDVDGLVRIGRRNRVVGASFATDRRQAEFFDPELKRLRASLSRALPGLPLVSFVDASADEGKLVLWAGSDVDPGRYYLYTKKTRELNELVPVRPQLAGAKLSPVKPVSYPAADGASVPGYLTLPPGAASAKGLPAIVMPHGGPGARDEWGFDWLAQYFAARGFAVLQPNFRGSTGYGDAWYRKNGFQSWRTAVGDVNDGGRWLVAQGADPAKLAILGWSYGGYAALQSAVLDPGLFRAIVAVAPVTDLEALRAESRDFSNYAMVDRFIGRGPHVREGSPAQNAARIKAPVLLLHGDRDDNVGIGQSRLMLSRLKAAGSRAEFVEFPGLDHQLDDAGARTRMLTRADAFLRTAMGM